jgi:uncharacterized membrane protein
MVAGLLSRLTALLLAAFILGAAPAAAHKNEQHDRSAPATVAEAPNGAAAEADHMAAMMAEEEDDRSAMSTVERLLDWLGRLHPVVVHFPLAFFPAALFTAIVGRRRPAFGKPVQFLVVAGGIIAPIAALLGWFDALSAEPGPLLTVHRWLGTAIGVAGLALALWAWKRPWEDRRPGMMWALAAITAAIVLQGWYGGALVHGADHMNW